MCCWTGALVWFAASSLSSFHHAPDDYHFNVSFINYSYLLWNKIEFTLFLFFFVQEKEEGKNSVACFNCHLRGQKTIWQVDPKPVNCQEVSEFIYVFVCVCLWKILCVCVLNKTTKLLVPMHIKVGCMDTLMWLCSYLPIIFLTLILRSLFLAVSYILSSSPSRRLNC